MKRLILAVAAALALPAMAHAQDIPRYDVEDHCEQVAGFGGSFSNSTYNGCIQMEQSAYNGLRDQWQQLPASIRQHCNDVASFGGAGSYSTLQGCVQMEVSAGENRDSFSFD
ncbi:hypothetical protein [Halomonas salipaludis]|uniref:Uncharacterized protein n=1 Tax=Halomonas salipaludis TaxID=2032625 RepID=A0A2A2EW16_9GAMM|nr:hypothetical protein [Halomonas salipaludis]PAU76547.1 hypothetical protein CK498_11125 [Halomonas salipaludis]